MMRKRSGHQLQVRGRLLKARQGNRQPKEKQRQKQHPRHRPTPQVKRRAPQQNRQGTHRHPRLQGAIRGGIQKRPDQHDREPKKIRIPHRTLESGIAMINQTGNDQRKHRAMLEVVFRIPGRPQPAQRGLMAPRTETRFTGVKPPQHHRHRHQRPPLAQQRQCPLGG